jgi:hypothetical protein
MPNPHTTELSLVMLHSSTNPGMYFCNSEIPLLTEERFMHVSVEAEF